MRSLVILLICIFPVTGQVFAGYLRDAVTELNAGLKGKTYYLRETFNSSPKIYCHSLGIKTYYEHKKSNLFPLSRKEQVAINSIDSTENSIIISFQHQHLGNGSIRIFNLGSSKDEIIENFYKAFNFAFSESLEDGFAPFIGNNQSQILHFIGCNHLPEKSFQETFTSAEEAEDRGYRQCNLCFMNVSRMPNYNLEMILGQKVAAEARYFYQLSENQILNRKVRKTGEQILSNWPTSLRGYNYSFQVLESDILKAIACPGGKIFITTGMLNALESDNELEAVLAREITHVELRHGWRQYKKGKSADFWRGLAKFAIGTTVGPIAKNVPAGLFTNILSSFSGIAAQIVMSGYSREFEQEADYYAVSYLMQQNDKQSMIKVLLKLQYYSSIQGIISERMKVLAKYPNIDDRINYVQNASVRRFPTDCIFSGYKKSGDIVGQIQFDSQCLALNNLEVFVKITTTSALGREQKIKTIKIITNGREHELENKEGIIIFPNDEVGCSFQIKKLELIDRIDGIILKLGEVNVWRKL